MAGSERTLGTRGHSTSLVLAHEKKLYQCSGRFIEIMPLLAVRYHARIAFDLLQGILRLLKSLLDCGQRSLMGIFFVFISWPDPCRSLKQQPGITRGLTGVEF